MCLLFPPKAAFVEKDLRRDMLLFLWDTMSQRKRSTWDISSQENQDNNPITNTSSAGMLVAEKRLGNPLLAPLPRRQLLYDGNVIRGKG